MIIIFCLSLLVCLTSSKLLTVLDVGSSGTKVNIYASKESLCGDNTETCKEAAITPNLAVLFGDKNKLSFVNALKKIYTDFQSAAITNSVPTGDVAGNEWTMVAYATAGNRIIDEVSDARTWLDLNSIISHSKAGHVTLGQTLAGTHEALYEFIAVNIELIRNSRGSKSLVVSDWITSPSFSAANFFSTGGASAQMAIVLTDGDSNRREFWFAAVQKFISSWDAYAHKIECNNQHNLNQFLKTVRYDVDSLSWVEVTNPSDCSGITCVALVSFLAGASSDSAKSPCYDASSGEWATKVPAHNLMGGQKEVAHTLAKYLPMNIPRLSKHKAPLKWSSNIPTSNSDFATMTDFKLEDSSSPPVAFTANDIVHYLYQMIDHDLLAKVVKCVTTCNDIGGLLAIDSGKSCSSLSDTFYGAGAVKFFANPKAAGKLNLNLPVYGTTKWGGYFGYVYTKFFEIVNYELSPAGGDWATAVAATEGTPYRCLNVKPRVAGRTRANGSAVEDCELGVDSVGFHVLEVLEDEINQLVS